MMRNDQPVDIDDFCNLTIKTLFKLKLILAAAILLACAGAEKSAQVSPPATEVETDTAAAVLIQPYDKLYVNIENVDELSGPVAVNANGQTLMPLIGVVEAAGLTAQQLANMLIRRYGEEYLQEPQISVQIVE